MELAGTLMEKSWMQHSSRSIFTTLEKTITNTLHGILHLITNMTYHIQAQPDSCSAAQLALSKVVHH